MRVVGEVDSLDCVEAAAAREAANVVILGQSDRNGGVACWPLLYVQPRMKVFAIGSDGREMSLYELRPHEVAFTDVSALGLVTAIRDSVAGDGH
jgi:hypothetical protein